MRDDQVGQQPERRTTGDGVEPPPQPADDGNTEAQQRRRFVWKLATVGLVVLSLLVVLLLACVLWIPKWLYPPLTDTDLQNVSDAAKAQELKAARQTLQNDARTTLLQGLGALLVLTGATAGVWVTLRQVRASHDQLKLSEQGQFTDRYTKAIDQLDDKNALAVRLGGLYALERIARDSPTDRATIAEVVCAYARTAPRPPVAVTAPTANPPSFTLRAPDVQAALAILGRWRERLGEPPPVLALHNADLQGADLVGAQLQDADLGRAQLQGAILYSAQLQGATLIGTQLQSAWLVDAQLQGARLVGAQLQGAWLIRAELQGAQLVGAELQDAKLDGAQLQGADLNAAQLREADLSDAQLQGARCSASTVWPDGFDWKAAGVILRED